MKALARLSVTAVRGFCVYAGNLLAENVGDVREVQRSIFAALFFLSFKKHQTLFAALIVFLFPAFSTA